MALEIEVKYLHVDHDALRQRLAGQGGVCRGRGFESNVVFDDAGRSLKAAGTLLRLREKDGRHVLTLKRAVAESTTTTAKVYEETETVVGDGTQMRAILEGLGYRPALRYEKVRETWTLAGCEVCLDTLPFGYFAEIEGAEQDIAVCAKALDLPQESASTATYHELNRLDREARRLPPDESFVFDDANKAQLLARRATDENGASPLDRRPRSA